MASEFMSKIAGVVAPSVVKATNQKQQAKRYGQELEKINSWFDDEYNRDFTESSMGKVFSNLLGQKMQEQGQQVDQKAAMSGGTAESKIASNSAIQQNYGDALANLSQYATSYRSNLKNNHFSQSLQLMGAQNKAQNDASDTQIAFNDKMADNVQQMMSTAAENVDMAAMLVGSDRKFKTDIKKVGQKKGVNIYSYRYIVDKYPFLPEGKQFGVIAQEVEHIPDAVVKRPEGLFVNTQAINNFFNS